MARKKSASADATDTPDTPRRSSPAALIIASLALLLALLAGGVAIWSNLQLQAVQGLSQRVSGDQTLLQNLTRRVDRLSEDGLEIREALLEQRDAMNTTLNESGKLAERLERAEQALASVPGLNQRSRSEWLKTEALYYLRIANAQALLTQDPDIAASALQLADEKLMQSGDPRVSNVRRQIANELTALDAMPAVDRAGISFRLQSLAVDASDWPLRETTPDKFRPEAEPVTAELGPWERFVATLKSVFGSIVTIKEADAPQVAQLDAAQQAMIVESLKAELQVARLAFARDNQALFSASIDRAVMLIEAYFDTDAAAVAGALASLKDVQSVEMPGAMPDISGSLALMLAAAEPAAAPQSAVGEPATAEPEQAAAPAEAE